MPLSEKSPAALAPVPLLFFTVLLPGQQQVPTTAIFDTGRHGDPVWATATGPRRQDPWGAEDPETRLRIPEPMVFDLVRPLGARAGELETNVLVLAPLRRDRKRPSADGDPLGIVPESSDARGVEWAPEIEWAPWNDFAIEFELPGEGDRVEAYKFAAQWTLGVHPERGYQHGVQGILQYDRLPDTFTGTLLYISGLRLERSWSLLTMLGGRAEFGGSTGDPKAELLVNASLFWDVGHHVSLGIETNTGLGSGGQRSFLLMPQLHWELTNRCMLQVGAGARWDEVSYLPEAGMRFVVTF